MHDAEEQGAAYNNQKLPTSEVASKRSSVARTYLFVPFKEKDEARALGALFDPQKKAWYILDDLDSAPFKRWAEPPRALTEQNIYDQFERALQAAGLVLNGPVQMDGGWRQTTVSTSKSIKALKGAYRGEIVDGMAHGFITNHDTGENRPWFPEGTTLSSKDRDHHRQLLDENRHQREQDTATQYEAVAARSKKKWEALEPALHPYLKRKQVGAFGLQRDGDSLVTPIRDVDGKIWSLQYLSAAERGNKLYEKNGQKTGHFHVLGDLNAGKTILFGEGYATCASLHMASQLPVVEVFDGGNISPVLRNLIPRLAGKTLIICGDDDVPTDERILNTLNKMIASDYAKPKLLLPEIFADEVVIDGKKHPLHTHPDCSLQLAYETNAEGVKRIVGELTNHVTGGQVSVKIVNPGREKALAAATEYGVEAVFPIFQSLAGSPTDFNDLHVREGLAAVRRQVGLAMLMRSPTSIAIQTPIDVARAQIGDAAVVSHAKDNHSQYVGPIIGNTPSHAVQNVGRQTAIAHDLRRLDKVPQVGQAARIVYSNGRGQVEVSQQTKSRTVER